MPREYLLVSEHARNSLSNLVNLALKQGWELYGNLVVVQEPDKLCLTYIQPMTQHKGESNESHS